MYKGALILLLCLASDCSQRHVIQLTPKLRQMGYDEDIDLGEVIAESVVDSPEACGRLCEENPVCHSVMLMGQLCRMFALPICQCSPELKSFAGSTSPLIGRDSSVTTFQNAMAKCLSLGAHSVHINSREEHDLIKQLIYSSAVSCSIVMTGGRSHFPGSTDMSDWCWHYNSYITGPSQPLTYDGWAPYQPNNLGDDQYYITLPHYLSYAFNDDGDDTGYGRCYLCECT